VQARAHVRARERGREARTEALPLAVLDAECADDDHADDCGGSRKGGAGVEDGDFVCAAAGAMCACSRCVRARALNARKAEKMRQPKRSRHLRLAAGNMPYLAIGSGGEQQPRAGAVAAAFGASLEAIGAAPAPMMARVLPTTGLVTVNAVRAARRRRGGGRVPTLDEA
jgi:hypothetical protein